MHKLRHTFASRWLGAGGSEGGLIAAGWNSREVVDRYQTLMQSIHDWGPAELHALLALVGPIALRVKAIAPVVPGVVALVTRPDDAAAQLQQQFLGGGAR